MPHHDKPLVITSLKGGHTDKHINTFCGQDQFLETRHALAAGRHEPGLKSLHFSLIKACWQLGMWNVDILHCQLPGLTKVQMKHVKKPFQIPDILCYFESMVRYNL